MAGPELSIDDFIANMPKAELHVHLEGCLTPGLVRTFAERNHLPLPASLHALDETGSAFAFHDLTSFLAVYYPNMQVLQTETDFHDLALDYLTRAAAQNVKHAEVFFDPQAHTSRGVAFATVVRGYRAAILHAERALGISAALIMCLLRDESAAYGMATLLSALPFKDCILGIGLDSDERDNPPSKFAAVYERARREGFLLTAHCDIDQPNTHTHIRQALDDLRVMRLDHGLNIASHPELTAQVRAAGIGLTACPVSNSVVTADFKGAEIVSLLRAGVRVTINSDDPAYFRAYLNENLLLLARGTDVTRRELVALARNAFQVSWISSWRRDHFLQMLERYELETLGPDTGTGTETNGV